MLLLLGDGTSLQVTELPGAGPWTFLVLDPDPGPAGGGAASFLTRFGRVVVPDLRGRPGWGGPAGGPGFLDLVDDLDQVRTRAGLGRPVLVGQAELVPLALRAAADQPWAWRALVLAPPTAHPPAPADLDRLNLPFLVLPAGPAPEEGPARVVRERAEGPDREEPEGVVDGPGGNGSEVAGAVQGLLEGLGGGPGWAGIAPDAPPR